MFSVIGVLNKHFMCSEIFLAQRSLALYLAPEEMMQ